MPTKNPFIKTLGEVAFRVADLEVMRKFYEETLGLEVLTRRPGMVFFRIAPDYGGHTQIFVLFDRSGRPGYSGVGPERSPLDHVAFTIDLADHEAAKAWLEGLGLEVIAKEQIGFGWRSLFIRDPEGNRVEFVCYDPSVPGLDS